MKTITMIIFCQMISFYSMSEIRNGYEMDLRNAQQIVTNLKGLLETADDDQGINKVKNQYLSAKSKLGHLNKYYTITEELIQTLQAIHPSVLLQWQAQARCW